MLIRCGYRIKMTFAEPTALVTMLAVRAGQANARLHEERHRSSLGDGNNEYIDLYGNRCQRLVAPAGAITLVGGSTVECDDAPDRVFPDAGEVAVAELPSSCLLFLLGSRYCETDRLSQFAWDRFGAVPPGWGRVQAICDFVHAHVHFDYGQASATRTALDTLEQQVGVCRDYTHLAIALCRCLNIPARYVNGHLGDIGVPVVDPMDFSAWMEVYLEGGWHVFDPRNNARRIGRIIIARGRDAADVPLINSFGPHELQQFQVWTFEDEQAAPSITARDRLKAVAAA
ncbi:transglutaminase-like domain-containing protein [Sandarakinorhabdus rubra]|uniref:transglutaminase-like domain-containing protein n=1 Tax=Sandarakinorhabdus rubra TaxID=2672568 RepID=UPI0013DB5FAC|nr:transglutaminase family protein [Sandarakinorhabdus rubra]